MTALTPGDRMALRGLYERLAAHWGWPMPASWKEDIKVMGKNGQDALATLRNLVKEQGL